MTEFSPEELAALDGIAWEIAKLTFVPDLSHKERDDQIDDYANHFAITRKALLERVLLSRKTKQAGTFGREA